MADYAEPLKAELTKRRIAFDAPKSRASEAIYVVTALRNWLANHRDDLAFRELLRAVCDGGMLGIPGPRARKAEKIAEREDALAKVSTHWNGVFGGASMRTSVGTGSAPPGNPHLTY